MVGSTPFYSGRTVTLRIKPGINTSTHVLGAILEVETRIKPDGNPSKHALGAMLDLETRMNPRVETRANTHLARYWNSEACDDRADAFYGKVFLSDGEILT